MIRLKRLKIASIVDEFTEYGLAKECILLNLSINNWKSEVEEFQPDLLFVESAWRGYQGQWTRQIHTYSNSLRELLQWCHEHGVPTVFWNKEDPVHFYTFYMCAQHFDWVFTTDLESIPIYKTLLGHERIGLLPFAISSSVYHPIEIGPRKNAVCFAGTYYRFQTKRCLSFEHIFNQIIPYMQFDIYNRNSHPENENYQFPEKYQPWIKGTLPVERIEEAYKGYRFGLTMNTVVDSSTMMARRIVELMASNTVVVSNQCKAVELMFGNLALQEQENDFNKTFITLSQDDIFYKKIRLLALRKVLTEHTYVNRLRYMVAHVLQEQSEATHYRVCIVSLVKNQMEAKRMLAAIRRQTYRELEWVFISETEINGEQKVKVIGEEKMNSLDALSDCDYYAYFSPKHYYGSHYIEDMIIALSYSSVQVIGKGCYYQKQANKLLWKEKVPEYSYGTGISLEQCLIPRKTAATITIGDVITSRVCYLVDQSYLSIDSFHYCMNCEEDTCNEVEDLVMNIGQSIEHLYKIAEQKQESDAIFEFSVEKDELKNNLIATDERVVFHPNHDYLTILRPSMKRARCYLTDIRRHSLQKLHDTKCMHIMVCCKKPCFVKFMILFIDSANQIIKTNLVMINQLSTIKIPSGAVYFVYRIIVENCSSIDLKGIYINPIFVRS